MENLKKRRKIMRTKITKTINAIETLLQEEFPDVHKIKAHMKIINEEHDKLITKNENIMDLLLEEDIKEEDMEAEVSSVLQYDENVEWIRNKTNDFINPHFHNITQSIHGSPQGS